MTSKQEISAWFDRGVKQGSRYMIVKCDTFDYDDYPVYVETDQDCIKVVDFPGQMQKVMEVYDLSADKESQLCEHRAMRIPK